MNTCTLLTVSLPWLWNNIKLKYIRKNKKGQDRLMEGTWPKCKIHIKCYALELPWWRSGSESACQYRGHGFEPWSGMIPHAAEPLGPCATTTESMRHDCWAWAPQLLRTTCLEPALRSGKGHHSERPACHGEQRPLLTAAGEGPRAVVRTRCSQK